ncbi:bifunctional NAD(P)H-hydrate repair enzyme Nnr [Abditibacteriota bacterium]|nr:bifunctional NAD(P)H-hydrate repair enzyme Nnr [Abditibacteriota bacterium]
MQTQKIDVELLKTMPLPAWDDESSKADRGKLLVVSGSKRVPGAAILVSRAALRSGCGTVRVAVPESVALAIGVAVPELLVVAVPETKTGTLAKSAVESVASECRACQALVVGPGVGAGSETEAAIREIVEAAPLPSVVDAEALTALGEGFSFTGVKAPRILTPHAKEFEVLANLSLEGADDEKRAKIAADYARAQKVILVLKARTTFVASPDGTVYRNEAGSRALGTAGSGDVLSGAIGSLLAQGVEPTRAAIWGVHLHALAGEGVAKDLGDDGVLASDFISHLPFVQRFLRRSTEGAAVAKKGFGLRM